MAVFVHILLFMLYPESMAGQKCPESMAGQKYRRRSFYSNKWQKLPSN